MSMVKTLELVNTTTSRQRGVLTFCLVQGKEVADMEASTCVPGATVFRADASPYRAYLAQQTGLTAQEFEPDGKVMDEIQRLYAYACMNLWSFRHAAVA